MRLFERQLVSLLRPFCAALWRCVLSDLPRRCHKAWPYFPALCRAQPTWTWRALKHSWLAWCGALAWNDRAFVIIARPQAASVLARGFECKFAHAFALRCRLNKTHTAAGRLCPTMPHPYPSLPPSHPAALQHRMNGGTNIALAVQKAGQLLKPLGPRTQRVLVLLTDGRIDSHQAGLEAGLTRIPSCCMVA